MIRLLKRIISLGLVMVLLVLLVACGGAQSQQTLKIGIMPDFDSIPFAVAKLQGYVPDNVQLEIFMSPIDRDAALYANELDGTISDVLAVCLANEGGFDVAITSKTDGCYGLLTAEPISSVTELQGMQIGMSINTIIEYMADRIISAGGGDPSLVEKVSVPKIPSRLELLGNGQIDAIAVPEPFVTAALAQGAYLVNTSTELSINPGVVLFTREAINDKGDMIKAVYKAYNKAVDYIQDNDAADFMPDVIAELGLPAEAIDASLPDYTHAEMPDESEVYAAMDWLHAKDLLNQEYTYDELIWRW